MILDYFVDRNYLSKKAVKHVTKMSEKHAKDIAVSIGLTNEYGPNDNVVTGTGHKIEMTVEQADSVSAVLKHALEGEKAAVANFASYKNPGGMFFKGSRAQEECLCHESTLYNVISVYKFYYEWNNEHKNRALYLNRALYSGKILFERGTVLQYCDVITCAAPNYGAANKYQLVTPEENSEALRSRIRFIKWVLEQNGVDVFIFGAFGCGVFRQDPYEVAQICKEEFAESNTIKKIYFSIIDEATTNIFKDVIEN